MRDFTCLGRRQHATRREPWAVCLVRDGVDSQLSIPCSSEKYIFERVGRRALTHREVDFSIIRKSRHAKN